MGACRACCMIRLYFNSHADAPLVWSVDEGPGTSEQKFAQVTVACTRGMTHYDPEADNITQPRAWIEYPKGRLVVTPCGAALILAG